MQKAKEAKMMQAYVCYL